MAFAVASTVLIPGVQPASPSYLKRRKDARRAVINERHSPLPRFHLRSGSVRAAAERLRTHRKEPLLSSVSFIAHLDLCWDSVFFLFLTAPGVFLHPERDQVGLDAADALIMLLVDFVSV